MWNKEVLKPILIILLVLVCLIPTVIYVITVLSQPVQKEQAEVIKKRTEDHYIDDGQGYVKSAKPWCYITFKFPDGTEKEFALKDSIFKVLQEGDTGTLSYKESKGGTKSSNRRFIRFEKDS